MEKITLNENVLDTEINIGDDFRGTLREFFVELAIKVWVEEEGFSGKRPWGNSGWKNDVYAELVRNGVLPGVINEYEELENVDKKEADALIVELLVNYAT